MPASRAARDEPRHRRHGVRRRPGPPASRRRARSRPACRRPTDSSLVTRRARGAGSAACAGRPSRTARPSVMTMSPVKSFEPRISDEPTPYASTGTPSASNSRILSTVKPPETTILTASKPDASSASRTLWTSRGLTPVGRKSPSSSQSERSTSDFRRVEPDAPEPRAERARDVERRAHRVVLEVDEHRHVHVVRRPVGEVPRRGDGVAAVGGDQRVRHRAEPGAAPPRRLLVGRDADRRARPPARRRRRRSRRRSARGGGRGGPA